MSASLDPATERAARAFLEKIAGRYEVTGAIVFGSRAGPWAAIAGCGAPS